MTKMVRTYVCTKYRLLTEKHEQQQGASGSNTSSDQYIKNPEIHQNAHMN